MARPDFLSVLERPDRSVVALEDSHRSVSYAELNCSVRTLAAGLARKGVSRGDRIAVILPNSAAAVELYLASALLGGIWVGINPAAPQAERARQCALVAPTLTITADNLSSLSDHGLRVFDAAPPSPSAPCAIGFTSGTTGTPKAVVHSRAAVSLVAAALANAQLHSDDRIGVILPMSIHNLIAVGVLPALFVGATCVAVERMSAAGVAAACSDRQLSMLNALVPATIYDLVHDEAITPDMLQSLRAAGTGAAGLAESLRLAFETKFNLRLVGTYGMTEAPGVVCIEDAAAPHTAGACGKPLPHLTVHACDSQGHPLAPGEQGELMVCAASSGPWADAYRPAIGTWTEHGFVRRSAVERCFSTGDYGWIDGDGAVYVTGRKDDVLVRGGVNVNAAELESVLGQLPGVRGVAIVGEDDERLGQRIVALVEMASELPMDAAKLKLLASDVLAHGKVPDEFIVGALPRNAMGKVARAELRRR